MTHCSSCGTTRGASVVQIWKECLRCVDMMTSSNGNIFRVTGPLCGEFTGPGEFPTQRPVTRSFDIYFDLRPNKRLSKQYRGWWFETQPPPLWRHRNGESTTSQCLDTICSALMKYTHAHPNRLLQYIPRNMHTVLLCFALLWLCNRS